MKMSNSGHDIDKGWAWLVLFASYINLLLCSGFAFVAGMFQLVFLEQFQESVAVTSWITALFSSFMQLGGPLSSVVCNWFSCRTSVMLGGALMSVGMFASSMASSLEMLFVTFGLISGAGLGLVYTASIIVINYFFLKKRTLVTGIALSASGFGIVVSPQIVRVLFDNFAWRETLVITAGASAHICITGALMSSMHEGLGRSGLFERCLSCTPWHRFQTSRLAYECSHDMDEEQKVMVEIRSADERIVTDRKDSHNTRDELVISSSCSNISHSSDREKNVQGNNQSSLFTTGVSNHQPMIKKYDSSRELIQCPEKDTHISIFVETVDKETKTSTTSSKLIDLNHQKDFLLDRVKIIHSGSHQELSSKPLLHKVLKKASNFDTGEKVANRMRISSMTQSNPNLIHRLAAGLSSRNLAASNRSLNCGNHASFSRITVVSRNPSLQGLMPPSTTQLDVIDITKPSTPGNVCPRASNILESQVILSGSLLSINKETIRNNDEHFEENHMSASKTLLAKYPSLYRNKYFWLLCTCLFIENAGCGIFNLHLASFVHSKGLTDQQLTNILSVNGCAILFGRCMSGALANAVRDMDLLIFWSLHVLGGLALCFLPFVGQSYISMVILVYCVGNYYGSAYSVLSSLTIEIVGLSNLATAFGIEMISAGLSFLISPPLAGVLVDVTNSYDSCIFIGGLCVVTGGMTVLLLPLLGLQTGRVIHADDITCDETEKGPGISVEDLE